MRVASPLWRLAMTVCNDVGGGDIGGGDVGDVGDGGVASALNASQ